MQCREDRLVFLAWAIIICTAVALPMAIDREAASLGKPSALLYA